MTFSLELGAFLALLGAVATTLALSLKHHGANAAPPMDLRRPVEAAARRFRQRWLAMRSIAHDEIVEEIHLATAGDARISPWLARFALDSLGQTATADPIAGTNTAPGPPSPCEQEVLLLIASGYTYEQTAARLHVSLSTIETRVSDVLRQLQRTDRGDG